MKSWIDISAGKLRSNFAALQEATGPAFEPLCVIKADAYGHGARLCAPVLVSAGAHWLGVSDVEEGTRVREALKEQGLASKGTRLLVMSGFEPEDAPEMVRYGMTPVLWTAAHVQALEAAGARAGQRLPVHLEIDTGMSRQGVTSGASLEDLLHVLQRAPHVRLEGVFSHFSSSEVAGSPVTARQLEAFHAAFAQILNHGMPEYVHLGNTSAVDEQTSLVWLRSATAQFHPRLLVRPGLAVYGCALPLEGLAARSQLKPALQPVATWKTRILDVREVPVGATVGYGATFVVDMPMRLALLPVGYADGFRREASSGVGDGWVMIAGTRAPVVGRVSMNLTVVDVTAHAAELAAGEEVILLGEGVTAEDHAAWCGTIAYEILCGMRGHRRLAV